MNYSPDKYIANHPITLSFDDQGIERREVYQINPKHRNGDKDKSQWIVSTEEEVHLFGWALECESLDQGFYWGVIYDSTGCRVLGLTTDKKESKIARFVGSGNHSIIWHGYPVDYISDPSHDCPSRSLLLKWASEGIISKPQISKLIRGQGWRG